MLSDKHNECVLIALGRFGEGGAQQISKSTEKVGAWGSSAQAWSVHDSWFEGGRLGGFMGIPDHDRWRP